MSTPTPIIRRRPIDKEMIRCAREARLHPAGARVLAGRPITKDRSVLSAVHPRLSHLDSYQGLPDIDKAAQRVAQAVLTDEIIALETDHDVDGVTSHAVLWRALTEYFGVPAERVQSFIGHRLKDGYGLSDPVADRILEAAPSLVITADNGSSDEPRIKRLAEAGIDIVVTDHHEIPEEGAPPSAYACVSPLRPESAYPDTRIAGCMVAWLLACAVRQKLIDAGRLPGNAPSLAGLLDYVAVGTVADCVSLAQSTNNRAVVLAGLPRINAGARPCWKAIRAHLWGEGPLTATDLAFGIGPRINARGRLDEAMAGVRFLLTESDAEAADLAALLEQENVTRKAIEKEMKTSAMAQAAEQVARGASAITVWLPDGHSGVHGIVASRVVETFGRPTVCISPKTGREDVVTGSARCVDGFHVRDALQSCAEAIPDVFLAFGGHAGAGGLTIRKDGIAAFAEAFAAAAARQLEGRELGPAIWTDGALPPEHMTLATVDALAGLEPYGREFELPVFEGEFDVEEVKIIGNGTHLRLRLRSGDQVLAAIWFSAIAEGGAPPVTPGQRARLVYSLQANEYRGERTVQAQVIQVA